MISYGQNFEDVMLWRALKHVKEGFYIDIGAQHPVTDSVSLAFYELGWRGVHVEPVPIYAQQLRDARRDETVLQAVIGDEAPLISLFVFPNTGLSTARADVALLHEAAGFKSERVEVPCIKLSSLFSNFPDREVHWMKIDVEGMEHSVLRSWPPSRTRPWVVLIEATQPLTSEPNFAEWEPLIIDLGYTFAYFDGLNRFYVSTMHKDLLHAFQAPPNVFDGFAFSGTASNGFLDRLKDEVRSTQTELGRLKEQYSEVVEKLMQANKTSQQAIANIEAVIREEKQSAISSIEEARLNEARTQQALESERQRIVMLLSHQEELRIRAELHIESIRHFVDETRLLERLIESRDGQVSELMKSNEKSHQAFADLETRTHLERMELVRTVSDRESRIKEMGERITSKELQAELTEKRLAEQVRASGTREQMLAEEFQEIRKRLEIQTDLHLQTERDINDRLSQALAVLKLELAVIRGSLSWRLTAFFRTVKGWLNHSETLTSESRDTSSPVSPESLEPLHSIGQVSEPMNNQNISPESEAQRAGASPTLEALLQHQDAAFIDCTYLTLLRRPADTPGRSYYLNRLRLGTPKIQLLSECYRSDEARLVNAYLPGLSAAIAKHKLAQIPLIGRLLNLVLNSESNSIGAKRLRIIEQQAFALASQAEARVTNIEKGLLKLQGLIVTQRKEFLGIAEKIGQFAVTSSLPPPIRIHNTAVQAATKRPQAASPQQRTLYYYVDHTVHCQTNTGLQRVTRRLAAALLSAGERVLFVKWDFHRQELVQISRDELDHLSKWNGPTLSRVQAAQYPEGSKDGEIIETRALTDGSWLVVPEVTHITFHSEPVTVQLIAAARSKGLRAAFIFYDAIPLRRPEHAPAAAAHEVYTQQLLLPDLVVPISKWVANDLVSFFHVHDHATLSPTPKITPILLPGESQLVPRVTKPIPAHGDEHLILSVGTIEPRKNQVALLHAFEAFCEKDPATDWQLFLAGNLHPDVAPEITRATGKNTNIRYLEHVSDTDLDALYRRCAFTVFPSVEEGFGLPILESLWYAKPCICADFGAMGEVAAGGGCLMINTRDERELLRSLQSLIESPELREKLSRESVARYFTDWSDYAARLTDEMDARVSPISNLGPVYYWVDHTCNYPANSGIQRVVRGLASALIKMGVQLIPIQWDPATQRPVEPTLAQLQHLSKWNGPPVMKWSKWREPRDTYGWILVPELTTYLSEPDVPGLRRYLKETGLRSAWIFHDAIPWKMRNIYPPAATTAHGVYMSGLNRQELVLATSNYTFEDYIRYISSQPQRTPGLFERVHQCPLPGEFSETPRVKLIKESNDQRVGILCVGSVEPRKNHLVLINAFRELALMTNIQMELKIAGGAPFPDLAKQIEDLIRLDPRIIWIKSPSDEALTKLYEECDFTVYASPEEGFGLPILESLWHARPCVCASFGAMVEVAQGGGCVTTDVRDSSQLATTMLKLVEDRKERELLMSEAIHRQFKTWQDYASEVVVRMASERMVPLRQTFPPMLNQQTFYREFANLKSRPILSICISTYNRSAWLSLNLRNLMRLWPEAGSQVEFLVCDNTSTDATPDVVAPYLARSDFRSIRNPKNVGMLGNLRVTANQARGEYIWILGDDDLLCRGAIERVLNAIRDNVGAALVYLNYSYTRLEDAAAVSDLDKFLRESTPIVSPGPDRVGTIRDICAESENFFTAIYCLVFRRDHAIRAYTQDTSGRPFSTLLTCIPTTYYVLNYMINEPACWVGDPVLVVNLNVSWMKYAPLWILERIPEVYDLAERLGGDSVGIDRWRKNNLPGVVHFLKQLFDNDPEGNASYFSMRRLASRLKGLEGIEEFLGPIRLIYQSAYEAGHPAAQQSAEEVFAGFNIS